MRYAVSLPQFELILVIRHTKNIINIEDAEYRSKEQFQ